eukprot:134206_1
MSHPQINHNQSHTAYNVQDNRTKVQFGRAQRKLLGRDPRLLRSDVGRAVRLGKRERKEFQQFQELQASQKLHDYNDLDNYNDFDNYTDFNNDNLSNNKRL